MGRHNLFEIKDALFFYGKLRVLAGLSLGIDSGSFYGIMGPNGCGKTTLLDLMARITYLSPGNSGHIKFRGININKYSRRKLAREIALVPQNFYINFPYTVDEVVFMGRHPHIPRFGSPSSEDREITDWAMRVMDIERFRDKFVTELSSGEKQRVVFARCLAQDTPVLLLDEGTSSMDIHYALKLLDLLRQGVSQGKKTIVAVLHDLNLAAAFCDRIVFMKAGRVVASGPTERVMTTENIKKVFNVDARIFHDPFSGSMQVAFRV